MERAEFAALSLGGDSISTLNSSVESLTKSALLGTGRDSTLPALEGSLQPFGQQFASPLTSPETSLLNAAAATLIARRAGLLPSQGQTPKIPVCPPETQPYFSARGTTLIDTCISAQRELVPQALALAGRTGQIAPPALLPRLLELGRGSRELRGLMAPILGERGRWLAQLNPEWRQIAAPIDADLEISWQEGENAARREALRLKRDQDPAGAREWVEKVFPSEAAKERVQWLQTLEDGLSQDDEPFLESALDDKSKEVRGVAVSLLEQLPESRLAQRAKTALEPLLKWNSKLGLLGRSNSLEVSLPTTWDKAWARDGLEEKVSPYHRARNLGEKASWVRQWLVRVSPHFWQETWKAKPADIIKAAPDEWRELLHFAWWEAALNFGDTEWLMAILNANPTQNNPVFYRFNGLTAEQGDQLAQVLWSKHHHELGSSSILAALLSAHPGPWHIDLARAFLKAAREEMLLGTKYKIDVDKAEAQKQRVNYPQRYLWFRSMLARLGDKFPVELAAEASTGWSDDPEIYEQWAPYLAPFQARLQLRADLQAEFTQSNS